MTHAWEGVKYVLIPFSVPPLFCPDIFAGSGTTAEAAEGLGRKWKSIDLDAEYVKTSLFRFLSDRNADDVTRLLGELERETVPMIEPVQMLLM